MDYLENFVHSQVHSLNDVSAVVENPPNVFGIDRAGEVWIAVVCIVLFAVSLTTLLGDLKKIVPDEVLGPGELPIGALVYLLLGFRRHHVVHELGEVLLQL